MLHYTQAALTGAAPSAGAQYAATLARQREAMQQRGVLAAQQKAARAQEQRAKAAQTQQEEADHVVDDAAVRACFCLPVPDGLKMISLGEVL